MVMRKYGGVNPDSAFDVERWYEEVWGRQLDCVLISVVFGPNPSKVSTHTHTQTDRQKTGRPGFVSVVVGPSPTGNFLFLFWFFGLPQRKNPCNANRFETGAATAPLILFGSRCPTCAAHVSDWPKLFSWNSFRLQLFISPDYLLMCQECLRLPQHVWRHSYLYCCLSLSEWFTRNLSSSTGKVRREVRRG